MENKTPQLKIRGNLARKKLNILVRRHIRKIRWIEFLLKKEEKYLEKGKIKYFFGYSIWTRKSPAEHRQTLNNLEHLIKELEEFIGVYSNKLNAWR